MCICIYFFQFGEFSSHHSEKPRETICSQSSDRQSQRVSWPGHWLLCLTALCCSYVFGSGEERSLRNLMGSALGGTDFEWAKTGDLRTQYMGDARENQPEQNEALLGNDLDSVATDPQFQV